MNSQFTNDELWAILLSLGQTIKQLFIRSHYADPMIGDNELRDTVAAYNKVKQELL